MNYVLVTVSGGIIEQVLFYDEEAEAIKALKEYVTTMDIERNDAAVYNPNGLISSAKDYLDE